MKSRGGRFGLAVLILLSLSCQKSTGPIYPGMVAYQVPGCRAGIEKFSTADSCFSYRFEDVLFLDFCAAGNCCPDSNRFSIQSEVHRDTIFVTLADTAAHGCRCMCRYMLHLELTDLPFPSYQFICTQRDESSATVLYSERVDRRGS